jgi:hypothetical protein
MGTPHDLFRNADMKNVSCILAPMSCKVGCEKEEPGFRGKSRQLSFPHRHWRMMSTLYVEAMTSLFHLKQDVNGDKYEARAVREIKVEKLDRVSLPA